MISRDKQKTILRGTEILLGVLILLLAIILITSVIFIYKDGAAGKFGVRDDGTNVIYTRSIIRERLLTPAYVWVPALLTGLCLIGVIILRILWPQKEGTPRQVTFRGFSVSPGILRLIRIMIVLAAAALVVAGILNGGVEDTLIKAINICTECLGLG